MKHYYYTIYRKDYLYKGLVLYESIKKHDPDFKFFVVCMEDESVELLQRLDYDSLVPISIKEIEEYDKRIPELKGQRGEKTYIWTAKASVPLYLFDKYKEIDHVIWLDGDTEFMSNPEPIYEQWGNYSVLLTEEKFVGEYEYLGHLVGFYNTGFMGFKRDDIGIKVLNYFRERLQEWKNTLEEQSNWNDQLYVDDWTERFPNVGVVKHNGINLTPFIASRMNVEENAYVNFKEGLPFIGDTPIVLYHFMALKYYENNEYDLCYYWMKLDKGTIDKLYIPYIKRCSEVFERVEAVAPGFYPPISKRYKYIGNYINLNIEAETDDYNFCTITDSNSLVQTLALYDSIKKHNIKFRLWICCEDEKAYDALNMLELPEILIFEPHNLIEYYYRLRAKGYKATKEIIKARMVNLITLVNHGVQSLIYVDNTCYFHQSPKLLFEILKDNSILMVNSRGIYSGALLGFTRCRDAQDCIFYWVEETKKWLNEGNNSQDEINLVSSWIGRYNKVKVLRKPCYLLEDRQLPDINLRKVNESLFIDDEKLIVYNYQLPDATENDIKSSLEQLMKSTTVKKKQMYLPYLKCIKSGIDLLKKIGIL